MVNTPMSPSRIHRHDHAAEGWRWVVCGKNLIRPQARLWLTMSALYLVTAALLKTIPFFGDLVLVLLTPWCLAGALVQLYAHAPGAAPATAAPLGTLIRTAARALFGVGKTNSSYAAAAFAIVTLGLVLAVQIVAYFAGGASVNAAFTAAQAGTPPSVTLLLGMLLVTVLKICLSMGLFYAGHLTVLENREPITAVVASFRVCARNPWSLTVFASVFLLPYLVIEVAFGAAAIVGYVLVFTVGLVLLPVFVAATYCSYEALFSPADHAT